MKVGMIARLAGAALFAAGLVGFASTQASAATELLVYTAIEADELQMFKEAFEEDYPEVDIQWVRDSTGIMTSKLMAEKDNPRADIVWGLAATSLMLLESEGYFQPYAPKGMGQLKGSFVDNDDPPVWVGQRAWIASICFNTIEAENKGLPKPSSWQDLTKPVYRGHVVMPNPNSSGTGFLDVSSWLQIWGEEEGWAFMDALHKNIAWYTHSGSKPCRQAAAGEVPIGVSFAYRGAQLKQKGAPIDIIAPDEGVGWDMESFAIVRNTDNLEAARKLADWSVTEKANRIYNHAYAVVAMPGVAKEVQYFPPDIEKKMIDNDFQWAAKNRRRILDTWRERYGAKSEPE